MSVVVITPPEPIVTLAEAKTHVRFSAPDDDAYLVSLVASVTDYLDGPKGCLGRALGAQVLEDRRHTFPGFPLYNRSLLPLWCFDGERFVVRVPPITGIVSITYADETGTDQQVDPTTLQFDEDRIEPNYDAGGWPCCRYALNSVRVRYAAGYAVVPAAVKAAILLMVGTLYTNREATPETAFAGAARCLLSPYAKVV